MDKELLFERIKEMITNSTKNPKYISFSSVKMADILGVRKSEIDKWVQELLAEGRLKKSKLQDPPSFDIYLLP